MRFEDVWERFIKSEVANGRYGSASEVVRDALRVLEARQIKLEALRAHLAEGAEQLKAREFVDSFSMDDLIKEMDAQSEQNV